MADCIIKAGESIDPTDSRLSDTACVIEDGVIIRPPPDLSVADEEAPKPKKSAPKIQKTPAVEKVPQVAAVEEAVIPEEVKQPAPVVVTEAHTSAPDPAPPDVPDDPPGVLNPTTVALAAGAAVAVAGTAAAGSAAGGLSALQAKIASLFGTSKGAVAATSVVAAGTIVAVKALEGKMNNLEQDLAKTKKEVGDTSSSIDRIDALLDRLGS